MSLPLYQTNAQRLIGVLQQWQTLLAPRRDATTVMTITLADVQAAILALQQTFGSAATLETIIQSLVARDLRDQFEQRPGTSCRASVA
jgi:hypothetical protein